jgi:hypothetical protein
LQIICHLKGVGKSEPFIPRFCTGRVLERLEHFPVVALLGARQVEEAVSEVTKNLYS